MSSKVKQANFRLPLEYMALIDDFARREDITKATVITRALDCMQASYDSGHGGMPVTGGSSAGGASDAELEDLRSQLSEAQARVQLSNANSMSLSPVTFDASTFTEESPVGAISMLNMLNGVMAAFKQQVKDARILGEQEGRKAQHTNSKMLSTKRVTMVIVMR